MVSDYPLPFFDMSWLAVRNPDIEVVIETLDLSEPKIVSWAKGLGAVCGDYWDGDADRYAHLSRVFITPAVSGWRLVVGGAFGWTKDGRPDGFRNTVSICCRLSDKFQQTHAYTTQGRMDTYAWILAAGGKAYREFVWNGEIFTNEGKPLPVEAALRTAWTKKYEWQPNETDVMAIAAESSVAPSTFEVATKSVGQGILAVTKWGRENGVPKRSLDDDES